MAGEWREAPINQLGRIVTGKTPPSTHPEYFGGSVPFVTPTDFDGRRLIERTGRYLSEAGAEFLQGCRIPRGAVMVSCIGSDMGKVAIAGRDCITNQQINSIIVDSTDDPLFVYYDLSTRKEEIRAAASGSAQPILNKSAFGQLPILLPSHGEQRAIARVLGALDDKIELNRRMNETLEAMARAIFKSWFVDFDPVRAKSEGRNPGLPELIADLFPREWGGPMGFKVPKGWKIVSFFDGMEVNPVRRLAKGEIAPYVDMQNMPTIGHRPLDWINRPFGSGTRFENGDTLLARITPCLENGKTAFVDFLKDGQVAWGSTEYIVLRPKPPLPPEYGYYLARSEEFRSHCIANMSGSSGRQRVPAECFCKYSLVTPIAPIAEKFGAIAKDIMATIRSNDEQSRTLAAIRDLLLPKLLSGKLRMSRPGIFMEVV